MCVFLFCLYNNNVYIIEVKAISPSLPRKFNQGGSSQEHKMRSCRPLELLLWLLLLLGFPVWEPVSAQDGFTDRQKNVENLFHAVDKDWDGHIKQIQFPESAEASSRKEIEVSRISRGTKESTHDLFFPYGSSFSYGGTTVSSEEMLDHLQNMLTTDRVVDWMIHGLQLPQYAEAFHLNAINGMDFPSLIEKEGFVLMKELQVQSALHRLKITRAIAQQLFGLGSAPGVPQNLTCKMASCDAIILHWTPPVFGGYPPLHKYIVQRWDDATTSWISRIDETKESTVIDTVGTDSHTEYSYRVQSWGGHGPSEWVTVHGCKVLCSQCMLGFCIEGQTHTMYDTATMDNPAVSSKAKDSEIKTQNTFVHTPGMWGFVFHFGLVLVTGALSRNSLFYHFIVGIWVLLKVRLFGEINLKLIGAKSSQSLMLRLCANGYRLACAYWQFLDARMRYALVCLQRWAFSPINKGFGNISELCITDCSPNAFKSASIKDCNSSACNDQTTNMDIGDEQANLNLHKKLNENIQRQAMLTDALCDEESFPSRSGAQIHLDPRSVSAPDRAMQHSLYLMSSISCHNKFQESNGRVSLSHYFKGKQSGVHHFEHPTRAMEEHDTMNYSKQCGGGSLDGSGRFFPKESRKSHADLCGFRHIAECPKDVYSFSFTSRASDISMSGHENWRPFGSFRHSQTTAPDLHGKTRFVCKFEGCSVRFDRFLSLTDWRMKFSRHYCRLCQFFYCIKHTQIYPHGRFGQCGLDSMCICVPCFERLPSDMKETLETESKLTMQQQCKIMKLVKRKICRRKDMSKTGRKATLQSTSDTMDRPEENENSSPDYSACLSPNVGECSGGSSSRCSQSSSPNCKNDIETFSLSGNPMMIHSQHWIDESCALELQNNSHEG